MGLEIPGDAERSDPVSRRTFLRLMAGGVATVALAEVAAKLKLLGGEDALAEEVELGPEFTKVEDRTVRDTLFEFLSSYGLAPERLEAWEALPPTAVAANIKVIANISADEGGNTPVGGSAALVEVNSGLGILIPSHVATQLRISSKYPIYIGIPDEKEVVLFYQVNRLPLHFYNNKAGGENVVLVFPDDDLLKYLSEKQLEGKIKPLKLVNSMDGASSDHFFYDPVDMREVSAESKGVSNYKETVEGVPREGLRRYIVRGFDMGDGKSGTPILFRKDGEVFVESIVSTRRQGISNDGRILTPLVSRVYATPVQLPDLSYVNTFSVGGIEYSWIESGRFPWVESSGPTHKVLEDGSLVWDEPVVGKIETLRYVWDRTTNK